jgi:hypothetical protein
MPVGVVGSDRKSRSKPPALIFINVSFSGVMSLTVVESVAIVVQVEEMECESNELDEKKRRMASVTYVLSAAVIEDQFH